MDISLLPGDIKSKICQYFIELQLLELNKNGWENIRTELSLFLLNKEDWHRHMIYYRTYRWRYSGYIVCSNPLLSKCLQIDRSRFRPCACGVINPPLPYTCKLKECRCGEKKALEVKEFNCYGCGRNPRCLWTIPLNILNITI